MLLAHLILLLPAALQDSVGHPEPAPIPPPKWTTSLSTYWIEPPHSSGYLSAVLAADKESLHLEAHWAYEDRDTFSVFAGKNIPIEGEIHGMFTPRIGVASGDSDGFVPAAALGLNWKKLGFTTDVEYLIGTNSDTTDFLYSWNELTCAVTDRVTVGLVGQRTNVFSERLSLDRGVLLGINLGRTRLTAYVFNPDLSDPYVTIAFAAGF